MNHCSDLQINDSVLQAACSGNFEDLKKIPKTDLHAHLLLSAPFEVYREISDGKILPPPARFDSLEHFIEYVRNNIIPLVTSEQAFIKILRGCLQHMVSDGIIYTELNFDARIPLLLKQTWSELAPLIQTECQYFQSKIKISPELGLGRDTPLVDWRTPVSEAIATGLFNGIDLYGSETSKPHTEFNDYFSMAREAGLKIKIHSGETSPPARMRQELQDIKPDAIQHGVRASEDPSLLKEIADTGVPVHVCPWSNYLLRIVAEYNQHPIRQMFDCGLNITLNSDDYGIFGKSVSEEYALLYEVKLFNAQELEQIRQNGLRLFSLNRVPQS